MSVSFALLGGRLRLESARPAFEDYVRVALEPFVVDDAVPADFEVELRWHDRPVPRGADRAYPGADWQRRPDRDLLLGRQRAWWARIDDFTDLTLEFDSSGQGLKIKGDYYFQIGPQRRLEPLRRALAGSGLARLEARRFSTLLYYLVYHPLLWRASRRDGWHLMHAGGVERSGQALAMIGAPGCGKSTLCVGLLADPCVRMLSDNLLLHDGSRVRAVPELMLLDERSLELAGEGRERLESTGERRVFGRDAYRPDRLALDPLPPRAIVYVERAERSRLEEISSDDASRRLQAGNRLAKEVRRVEIMNEVLDLVMGAVAPDALAAAKSLMDSAPTWRLEVGADGDARGLAAALLGKGNR